MGAVETVVDTHSLLGEGPVWSESDQALYWVDILGRSVHRWRPAAEEHEVFYVPRTVGCLAVRRRGGLILGLEDEVVGFEPETGQLTPIAPIEAGDRSTRINDGACDPAGRFWVGTQPWDESRIGASSLWRIDAHGRVALALGGITIGNGLGWSLDAETMYFIDTATGGVDAFDYELTTGGISNRRQLIAIPEAEGYPDGLTMDADGCLWVALWGGGEVRRYSPSGELLERVPVPCPQPTSCAFGGPDLDQLFISSATMELSHDQLLEHPRSGALFRYRGRVRGQTYAAFAG